MESELVSYRGNPSERTGGPNTILGAVGVSEDEMVDTR